MSRRVSLGIVVLAAGVLWLLSVTDILNLSYGTWIGAILVVIGLAVALVPGRHGLLVLIGVLVAIAGLPALVIEENVFEGGVGEAAESPSSVSDLETYRHGIGKLTVDLSSPGLDADAASIRASVGIGELVVIVPLGADVTVDAHAGMGNVEALRETESGIDVDLEETFSGSGAQKLDLDLEVGIGNIRVQRGPGI